MAPRLRSDGRLRRRIRQWATPFVVTVALSPACSKENKGTESGPNPPAPSVADAGTAPTPKQPPPRDPSTITVVPPQGWAYLGEIRRDATDCKLYWHADCPTGSKCNPPAPEVVACPTTWMKEGQQGHALKRQDASCEFWPPDGCPKVPAGQPIPPCNPPPPVDIPCPSSIVAAKGPEDHIGDLHKGGDKCSFEAVATCPPNVPCNPPAPRDVACPDAMKNDGSAKVDRLADGKCELEPDKGAKATIPCP